MARLAAPYFIKECKRREQIGPTKRLNVFR